MNKFSFVRKVVIGDYNYEAEYNSPDIEDNIKEIREFLDKERDDFVTFLRRIEEEEDGVMYS